MLTIASPQTLAQRCQRVPPFPQRPTSADVTPPVLSRRSASSARRPIGSAALRANAAGRIKRHQTRRTSGMLSRSAGQVRHCSRRSRRARWLSRRHALRRVRARMRGGARRANADARRCACAMLTCRRDFRQRRYGGDSVRVGRYTHAATRRQTRDGPTPVKPEVRAKPPDAEPRRHAGSPPAPRHRRYRPGTSTGGSEPPPAKACPASSRRCAITIYRDARDARRARRRARA